MSPGQRWCFALQQAKELPVDCSQRLFLRAV